MLLFCATWAGRRHLAGPGRIHRGQRRISRRRRTGPNLKDVDMHCTLFTISCLTAAITTSGALAANLVIIDSNVAALPVGSSTPDTSAVALSEGQTLVLIAEDGGTLVVEGPYSGPIGEGATNALGSLGRLGKSREKSPRVVGAIRGMVPKD
jgi:hypothetical protein